MKLLWTETFCEMKTNLPPRDSCCEHTVKAYKDSVFLLSPLFLCLASHSNMEGPQCEATGTRIVLSLQPGHCWIVLPKQKELVSAKLLCFLLAGWGHCTSPPGSAILSSFYPICPCYVGRQVTTIVLARFFPDGYQSSSLGVREAVLS